MIVGAVVALHPVACRGETGVSHAANTAPPVPVSRTNLRILALYHIGKTGGSSIFYWFQQQLHARVFNYFHTHCFYAMPQHRDLFHPRFSKRELIDHCARKGYNPEAIERSDTQSDLVIVEFHGFSQAEFWRTFDAPRRTALRARHRSFVTMVMLRDPQPHILSFYTMWGWVPQEVHRRAGLLVTPLAEFLTSGSASGLQTRALLDALTMEEEHEGNCTFMSPLAVRRLQSFDVACNLRWMGECMRAVARDLLIDGVERHAARLSTERPGQSRELHTKDAASLMGVARATSMELAKLNTNISYGLVRDAASCDQLLMDAEAQWATPPARGAATDPPPLLSNKSSVAAHGHCGATLLGGDCSVGRSGAWNLKSYETGSWQSARAACSRRCLDCTQCHFVSVSIRLRECSWYHACTMEALNDEDDGQWRSMAVLRRHEARRL